eukprot:3778539-Pleurochrysis_carterae.AAC.1
MNGYEVNMVSACDILRVLLASSLCETLCMFPCPAGNFMVAEFVPLVPGRSKELMSFAKQFETCGKIWGGDMCVQSFIAASAHEFSFKAQIRLQQRFRQGNRTDKTYRGLTLAGRYAFYVSFLNPATPGSSIVSNSILATKE